MIPQFFKSPEEKRLKQLKEEASELQIAKNSLVFEQVRINVALTKPEEVKNASALTKRKKEIDELLKAPQYTEKLPALMKKIATLEEKIYGHTDIGSSRPNFLNS